jgi:hypothetical protein
MRCVFYFWQIVSEYDIAQTAGLVVMILLGRSNASGSRLDNSIKTGVDMVYHAFPTHFETIHLVNCPSGIGQRIFLEVLVPIMVSKSSFVFRSRAW